MVYISVMDLNLGKASLASSIEETQVHARPFQEYALGEDLGLAGVQFWRAKKSSKCNSCESRP